ncbi:MAG: DUF2330 domain-containing protein [Polyangiaceae bacterium]|nr:DUF2330 domain-containing protein [Polyangiaceae bacterium]
MVGWLRSLVFALGALLGVALAAPPPAQACGGFFSRKTLSGPQRPSLSYEQTLIVFDAEKRHQHFIREVAFRAAAEPFGFVVPTPTRPTVAKVEHSPFESLRREFRFETGIGLGSIGFGRGAGTGQGFGRGAGVTVLEQKRIGSFTAFVLSASDETALGQWLKKNGLVSSTETDPWLAHYVKMKFYYVAMRYEPGDKPKNPSAPGNLQSETVRISFDTPRAYYPYFEPNLPQGVTRTEPRMLELWLVSRAPTVPVALRQSEGKRTWVRPLQAGQQYRAPRDGLTRALDKDATLLPEGELVLQTFIDQKRSRQGFGDVLFLPEQPDSVTREQLASLLPILDPSLTGGAP